jgi:hypothetical protein
VRRGALVVACCIAAAVTLVAPPAPAGAHTWQDYYRHGTYTSRWDVAEIRWYFDTAYWNRGVAFRDRAREAAATWSNVLSNGYVRFREMDALGQNTYEQCSYNGGLNYLRWASLTGAAATTWYCYRPSPSADEWSVQGFAITIDSEPAFGDGTPATWYAGTGAGTGTQVDLLSALTHEFGHAGGHNIHFDEPALCPNDPAADHSHSPTMCAGVWYGNDTNRRTLQDHDVHTMQGAYAQPPPPPTTTTTQSAGGIGVKPGCDMYRSSLQAVSGFVRSCA